MIRDKNYIYIYVYVIIIIMRDLLQLDPPFSSLSSNINFIDVT